MTSLPPVGEPGVDPGTGRSATSADRSRRERPPRSHDEPGGPARDADRLPPAGAGGDRADLPRYETEPAGDVPPRAVAPEEVLPQHRIGRTRTGGLWVAVAAAALVLLFLLIFILENSQPVQVSFFGADGHLALGVALLLSAVAGALLVVLVGTARIVQLRFVARRHRATDVAAVGGEPRRRRFGRH
jgi:uncharacterized integral membrane protein